MSWVCPDCNTNNEDDDTECIVCGAAKPPKPLGDRLAPQVASLTSTLSEIYGQKQPSPPPPAEAPIGERLGEQVRAAGAGLAAFFAKKKTED